MLVNPGSVFPFLQLDQQLREVVYNRVHDDSPLFRRCERGVTLNAGARVATPLLVDHYRRAGPHVAPQIFRGRKSKISHGFTHIDQGRDAGASSTEVSISQACDTPPGKL